MGRQGSATGKLGPTPNMKTIHPIDRTPASESHDNNLWDVDASPDHPACLRAVLLRRPDAHIVWHDYLVSVVHLRPIDGQQANLIYEDSTHEIICAALDPKFDNQPTNDSLHLLLPLNLAYQLRGSDDAQAKQVFSLYVEALASGLLSPDTDHRHSQIVVLDTLCRGVQVQH